MATSTPHCSTRLTSTARSPAAETHQHEATDHHAETNLAGSAQWQAQHDRAYVREHEAESIQAGPRRRTART